MLALNSSSKFKKDFKTCIKRGYNMKLLEDVINILRVPEPLPQKNKDHNLSGNWNEHRECHILPDWLLIYRVYDEELYLVRTGMQIYLVCRNAYDNNNFCYFLWHIETCEKIAK